MDSILYQEVFAGLKVWQLAAGAVGLVLFLKVWSQLTRRKPHTQATFRASCACGWTGEASRFTRQCPKCRAPLTR